MYWALRSAWRGWGQIGEDWQIAQWTNVGDLLGLELIQDQAFLGKPMGRPHLRRNPQHPAWGLDPMRCHPILQQRSAASAAARWPPHPKPRLMFSAPFLFCPCPYGSPFPTKAINMPGYSAALIYLEFCVCGYK
jgi:hypothetical protein